MAEVPADLISNVLTESYNIDAARIAPTTPGEMAWAYETITASGERWFVKVRPDDPCWPLPKERLDAALALTFELHESVHSADIVIPVLSAQGSPSVAYGGYLISVFPFLDLQPLGRRAAWTDEVLRTVASAVAEIQATVPKGPSPFTEDFELWHQEALPHVLAGIGQLGPGARPGQLRGQAVVAAMAAELSRLIDCCTELRSQVVSTRQPQVICHTDLTPDNVTIDPQGRIHILDWDQLQLGPAEFDVRWVFQPGRFDLALDAYESIRGPVKLSAEVFGFYVCRRYLEELAYYGCRLLRPGRTGQQDSYDVGQLESATWAFDGGMERWIEEFRECSQGR